MLEQLLANLYSRNDYIRGETLRKASTLPPENLLWLFEKASKRARQWTQRNSIIFWAVLFSIGVFVCGLLNFESFALLCIIFSLPLLSIGQIRGQANERVLKSLSTLISEQGDMKFIFSTLQSLELVRDSETHKNLRGLLKRLLSQVRADDTKKWTKEQKSLLLIPLHDWTKDRELALITLKVLEQVGGEEAFVTVEGLSRLAFPSAALQRIPQAAQECLPYLYAHANETRQAQTLLRPAEMAQAPHDELLLPASARHDDTPKEQLLRPGQIKE